MYRVISNRRSDVPKIRELIFKSLFSKLEKCILKIGNSGKASITVSRLNEEAVHEVWKESEYVFWKSDAPKNRYVKRCMEY